jgi:hypothetical protein
MLILEKPHPDHVRCTRSSSEGSSSCCEGRRQFISQRSKHGERRKGDTRIPKWNKRGSVHGVRTGDYLFSHLRGTHDDLAYALALAVWAAKADGGRTVIMMKDEPPGPKGWREREGGIPG